jgi:hypothetical protein
MRDTTSECKTDSWFARLPLGHLEETNGRAPAIRVDDGRVGGLIEIGFLDIAEGQRPESSDPQGIVGIASQGPKSRHGANVRELQHAVIGKLSRGCRREIVTLR